MVDPLFLLRVMPGHGCQSGIRIQHTRCLRMYAELDQIQSFDDEVLVESGHLSTDHANLPQSGG